MNKTAGGWAWSARAVSSLLVIGFVLPWASVTCTAPDGTTLSLNLNGMDLSKAQAEFFLVLFAGIVAFAVSVMSVDAALASWACIGCGVLAGLPFAANQMLNSGSTRLYGTLVSYDLQIGVWVIGLGVVGLIVVGVVGLTSDGPESGWGGSVMPRSDGAEPAKPWRPPGDAGAWGDPVKSNWGGAQPLPTVAPVPKVPPGEVRGWLVVKRGSGLGQRFDLRDETEIGREPRCEVLLDDSFVSRSHARIRYEDGSFFLYDIGSSSGTFVNERKIQRVMLYDGMVIRVGGTELEFKRSSLR